jgi:uncharacterized membrane protein
MTKPAAPPTHVLFDDKHLRLIQCGEKFVLEYLADGDVVMSEQFTCKLCAIRAVLLATVELKGHCNCSPPSWRIENEDVVSQIAGGLN